MVKYICLPESEEGKIHKLPFYFAVEELVAAKYKEGEYFFIWQVEPTVMLGRNQLLQNEINEQFCRANKIDIFRRKSGGGCIFADMGCLQFSYITSEGSVTSAVGVNSAFEHYIKMICEAMGQLGINVSRSGRNDILIGDKKVSGAAMYRFGKRSVLHNSLLYSVDFTMLERAITPAGEKLESKGVSSIRAHVDNISRHTGLALGEFVAKMREIICGGEVLRLTAEDMAQVAELEKVIASKEFVYDNSPAYTVKKRLRLPGVGGLEAGIMLKNGVIQHINLVGDYFLVGDLDSGLLNHLKGALYERNSVASALFNVKPEEVIRNLTITGFLDLLFGRPEHVKKPEWLKISLRSSALTAKTQSAVREHHLHTICSSGLCPNKAECWRAGTASFMIGGNICTRSCRFCNTLSGRPLPLDKNEPLNVAKAVKELNLRYAVITSVDRDDLPDMGASHWAATICEIRRLNPSTTIEVLMPDFRGDKSLIDKVLEAQPKVVAHNIETVRRLTPIARSVATYDGSLGVLKYVAKKGFIAKTGIMVGLGETVEEVEQTMDDLINVGCKILTIGQYLQPSPRHLAVKEYVTPAQFAAYKETALKKGFTFVESAPFVRSSYHAEKTVCG